MSFLQVLSEASGVASSGGEPPATNVAVSKGGILLVSGAVVPDLGFFQAGDFVLNCGKCAVH